MSRLFMRLRGTVRVEICGAFPETVLNACALRSVLLWDMECVDKYTVRARVYENELEILENIAQRSMCQLRVLEQKGGSRDRRALRRRYMLLISAAVVAALLCVSCLFIWEIEIHGCSELSGAMVLRALEDCGVREGSFWPAISADLVRSRMMTKLPELGWMTVNISGSRAIVLVSERQPKPEIYVESKACDIIAGKTGIITRISVQNGKAMVRAGQAVLEGETLVSGTMDSISNSPRFVRAQAQIWADTWYELCSVYPVDGIFKGEVISRKNRFALKFGKSRVNLYPEKEKNVDEYDKMIYEYSLGVKGLFALPISIVREEYIRRSEATAQLPDTAELEARLLDYLRGQIDGEIISYSFTLLEKEGGIYLSLRAHCIENIAVNAELAGDTAGSAPPETKGLT